MDNYNIELFISRIGSCWHPSFFFSRIVLMRALPPKCYPSGLPIGPTETKCHWNNILLLSDRETWFTHSIQGLDWTHVKHRIGRMQWFIVNLIHLQITLIWKITELLIVTRWGFFWWFKSLIKGGFPAFKIIFKFHRVSYDSLGIQEYTINPN